MGNANEFSAKMNCSKQDVHFRDTPRETPSTSTPPSPSPSPPVTHRVYHEEYVPPQVKNKEVEDFYIEKLKELQERHAALQKITNDHFASAVKEVEQKFVTVTASPVCQDLQAKVLECYQTNPKEILNCAAVVSAFTTCVDRARMQTLNISDEDCKVLKG